MATPFRGAAAAHQASAGANFPFSPVPRSDSVADMANMRTPRFLPLGAALDDSLDASRHYHI
jgi:hypothetical protein